MSLLPGFRPHSRDLAPQETPIPSETDIAVQLALAITLAKLSDLLGILPGFAFFNEGTGGQNAFASRSRRLGRDDGSVVFGQVMFGKLMQSQDSPELGVAAVCSHEFGHILQFKMDLQNRLVGPDGRVKRLELHADYLAGYFAGLRKRERADFPAAIFAQTQYDFGDTAYAEPTIMARRTNAARPWSLDFKRHTATARDCRPRSKRDQIRRHDVVHDVSHDTWIDGTWTRG